MSDCTYALRSKKAKLDDCIEDEPMSQIQELELALERNQYTCVLSLIKSLCTTTVLEQRLSTRILEYAIDVRKRISDFHTLEEYSDVVRLILCHQEVNLNSQEGEQILLKAVESGDTDIAVILVQAHANVNARNPRNNRTLLQEVMKNHNVKPRGNNPQYFLEGKKCCSIQLAVVLLKHGAEFDALEGSQWLWMALKEGHTGIAVELVRRGADLNICESNDNHSVLHEVLRSPKITMTDELASLMIENGADVNAYDDKGCSILHDAIVYGCCSSLLIEQLMALGATRKESFLDDIYMAARTKPELLPKLVQHLVPDKETRNRRGVYVIESLISMNCTGVQLAKALKAIREILDAGVPASSPGKLHGKQPCSLLNLALRYQNKDVIKLLLDYGADPQEKDNHGCTPLYQAAGFKDCTLASRWFIEKGANIHACNDDGQYPIHAACKSKSVQNLHLLLSLGADPNVTDKKGCTPFDSMVTTDYTGVARLMIKHFALIIAKNGKIRDKDIANINFKSYCRIYYHECLTEIDNMKAKDICPGVPYFTMLSGNMYDMLKLMKNTALANDFKLNTRSLSKLFPIYHDMLSHSFKIAEGRSKLVVEEPIRIQEAFEGYLPDLVMENIVKYSTPEAMKRYQYKYYMALHATIKCQS